MSGEWWGQQGNGYKWVKKAKWGGRGQAGDGIYIGDWWE